MEGFILGARRIVKVARIWARKHPVAASSLVVHITAALVELEDEDDGGETPMEGGE